MSIRQQLSQKELKDPWTVPICFRGIILPDPSVGGDWLFPEHMRLFTPSRRYPNLPYLEPSQGLPRMAKCCSSDLPGGKIPFHVWEGTSGCFKALGSLATSLHSISYDCCPRFPRGWGRQTLRWSSRRCSLGPVTIELKRSDSLRHLQGLVGNLISWGACYLRKMTVTNWEYSSLLLLPSCPLVPLKLSAQLLR